MATNIMVSDELHSRLSGMKPYDSMSFNDLLRDMVDQYEPPRAPAGGE